MTKMTKRTAYEELLTLATGNEALTNFVEKQIASIDATAEKARIRAAAKKENDTLIDDVKSVLDQATDYMTAGEIAEAVGSTNSKVIARLTKLANTGAVTKVDMKIDKRIVKGYRTSTPANV